MRYYPNSMTIEETYHEHMKKYADETAVLSFTKYNHPSYMAMLKMGKPILPLLLKDIQSQHPDGSWTPGERNYSFWGAMSLAFSIAGEEAPKIPQEARGRLPLLRAIWINWGLQRGMLNDADEPKIPIRLDQAYRFVPKRFVGIRNYIWRLTTWPNTHRMKHKWDFWRAI
jgi:hypothetical protein